jgi:hypothetical protein
MEQPNPALTESIEARIRLYEAKKPYREQPSIAK